MPGLARFFLLPVNHAWHEEMTVEQLYAEHGPPEPTDRSGLLGSVQEESQSESEADLDQWERA